jgi:predicted metal-dependent hydrolase
MPANLNIMWSNGRSEAALAAALPAPIVIRPMRNARRLRLRYDEASGTLRLTCPWRTSRRSALAWALDQRAWIEEQLARAAPVEPLEPGLKIPIEGREITITWFEAAPRAPLLTDAELRCGGPLSGVPRRIELFLRTLALAAMRRDADDYASRAGLEVHSISVGDAASRWGSCSSKGRIRLSWRLILAPPDVRRYVVAHEVAHLRHLDHGPEFKALEAELFGPGLAEAKASLKRLGPSLRRVGRGR